ncbi:MAG: 1-acyl-sn-glycerol-3-phosphate acyltransferase [Cyclobacteriaceae bacterium]|nr:1-acyl-sn-glycerol-3-phosphate acyltransferase [Cyclobacteriaceae bacterium]
MKIFREIGSWLFTFWALLVFITCMLTLLPCVVVPLLAGTRISFIGYKALWVWAKTFSVLTQIKYQFIGREKLNTNTSYIFASNHTSFLDAPGVRLMIPGEFRPIAKKELSRIPVFGWVVSSACILVDRGKPESRKKSLQQIIEILRHKISALIFVEGTQNRTKELLQPFKDGAFRMSFETNTPVVPMVIIGAADLMKPGKLKIKSPGTIKIVLGDILYPQDFEENISAFKEKTFRVMTNLIQQNK